jgi:L-alanine-DL-glutamate epimerase-like enolase superfamily enzyme
MVESSLGIAAALQLAGLADHVDLDGALLLARDPYAGMTVEGDRLTASDEPGLGVRRREESLKPAMRGAPRAGPPRHGPR